jgi:hypothetical protein
MTHNLRPFFNDKVTILIRERLAVLTAIKPERVIAAEAGFKSTNMLSMIKGGRCKVPLERVTGIAHVIGCDPMLLLRLALEQHFADGSEELNYARMICSTANEREIIDRVRSVSKDGDPEITPAMAEVLELAFS